MEVTLIDSPVSNRDNVHRALVEVGARVTLSADPEVIARSPRIVLPGVGSFSAAMAWLIDSGIADAIRRAVDSGSFLLGICVGHQLLFEESDEMGVTRGLGLCSGRVRRFETDLPVPQVGWNCVDVERDPLFDGIESGTAFYFVNSYHAATVPPEAQIASALYGPRFNAAVRSGRVRGVQFHPEKSHDAGLRVLKNFVELDG